jgi:hypothetical protein
MAEGLGEQEGAEARRACDWPRPTVELTRPAAFDKGQRSPQAPPRRRRSAARAEDRDKLTPAGAGARYGRLVRPCRSEGKASRRLRSRGKPSSRHRSGCRRRGCSRRCSGRTGIRWPKPQLPQLSSSFPLRLWAGPPPSPGTPGDMFIFPKQGLQMKPRAVVARLFGRKPYHQRGAALDPRRGAQRSGSGQSCVRRRRGATWAPLQ